MFSKLAPALVSQFQFDYKKARTEAMTEATAPAALVINACVNSPMLRVPFIFYLLSKNDVAVPFYLPDNKTLFRRQNKRGRLPTANGFIINLGEVRLGYVFVCFLRLVRGGRIPPSSLPGRTDGFEKDRGMVVCMLRSAMWPRPDLRHLSEPGGTTYKPLPYGRWSPARGIGPLPSVPMRQY